MGGKLSKKKKGYNVNDEKAKEKDKKAEGAVAEEGEALKEGEQPVSTEAAEVKENSKEEKGGEPEAQVAANKTDEKEGEKEKAVSPEEPKKAEPEKVEAMVDAKAEPPKNNEQQTVKPEEPTSAAAPPPASGDVPKQPSETSGEAKASQLSEATAPSKVDDKGKEEGEAKKTEAPAVPASQETKSEAAPASDSKPSSSSSSEATPSSKETPATTEAPSSTQKASEPAAPPEETKPSEAPATNSDQTITVKD